MPAPLLLPSIGELVGGRYRVERFLAEGGMGVLFAARHVELEEEVALKFLRPDLMAADETLAPRFLREARATIKIRSEHVPRILDVASARANGLPYIAMELLSGEDLEQQLERDGPLPVMRAVEYMLQALEALGAAHALGIVHRDFKPANLFVATRLDGTPCIKVLDFGIAKVLDPGVDPCRTETSALMGSPRYMAPEQMRAMHTVDERADVWAVGTTLYELLTGEPAFVGETLTAVCASVLEDEPSPIRARRPDVPRELERVVRRCLAKRVDHRFANVAEVAAALSPFAESTSARESAARIARVRGLSSHASGSLPAPSSRPRSTGSVSDRRASPAASTQATWGTAAGEPRRGKRLLQIGSVAGALLLVVTFVTAMLAGRSRTSRARLTTAGGGEAAPSATTAPEIAPASAAGVPAPIEPSEPPSVASAREPVPSARVVRATPRPPPSATHMEPRPAKPEPPPANLWNDRK